MATTLLKAGRTFSLPSTGAAAATLPLPAISFSYKGSTPRLLTIGDAHLFRQTWVITRMGLDNEGAPSVVAHPMVRGSVEYVGFQLSFAPEHHAFFTWMAVDDRVAKQARFLAVVAKQAKELCLPAEQVCRAVRAEMQLLDVAQGERIKARERIRLSYRSRRSATDATNG